MDVERILILERGSFCHYDPMLDLIVISKCYQEDPDFFEFVLEHERDHRKIHIERGYRGVLHHVILDWKNRASFMTSNYPRFRKFVKLGRDDSERTKNILSVLVYNVLTLPTGFFQMIALNRMFFDRIRGFIKGLF